MCRDAARLAAVRRALGPLLDGRRPLCRHGRRQCRLSRSPKRGCIAITSSTRSTPTNLTISSSASRSPATFWRKDGPAETYAERVIATGFLALSRRYATAPYELWHLTLEDTIDTVGRAYLGITLRCARCHDHKFDPVPTRDYYRAVRRLRQHAVSRMPARKNSMSMKFGRTRPLLPLVPEAAAAPLLVAYQPRDRHGPQRNRSACRPDIRDGDRRRSSSNRCSRRLQGPRAAAGLRSPAGRLRGQRRDRRPTRHPTPRRAQPTRGDCPARRAPLPPRLPGDGARPPTKAAGWSWPTGSPRRAIRSPRA